jgi:hypothetical protein
MCCSVQSLDDSQKVNNVLSSTFLEGLKEHLKIHTRPPSQNSNLGHFKYEAGVLVTQPRFLINLIFWNIEALPTYFSSTFLEGLREHLKIHTRPPSQNSNLGHFKYEAGVLVTQPRFLINIIFWNIEALLFTKRLIERLAHPVKHNKAYLCPCLQAHRGCPSCRWWKPQWSWWMSAGTAWGLDHSRSRTGRRSRCCPRYLETSAHVTLSLLMDICWRYVTSQRMSDLSAVRVR